MDMAEQQQPDAPYIEVEASEQVTLRSAHIDEQLDTSIASDCKLVKDLIEVDGQGRIYCRRRSLPTRCRNGTHTRFHSTRSQRSPQHSILRSGCECDRSAGKFDTCERLICICATACARESLSVFNNSDLHPVLLQFSRFRHIELCINDRFCYVPLLHAYMR